MKRTYKVTDASGVHARPAALLVNAASKYPEDINIIYKDQTYTLKSIMIIMSLGIKQDETFDIEVEGDNATSILNNLESILKEHNLV